MDKKPAKKAVVEVKMASEVHGLTIAVVHADGKSSDTMALPKELFGGSINKQLMAQAVRVYLANQREGSAGTKTRGMVEGSTRKIYRQKGTGNARHGSIRAPIFVGGGIVFGPVPHDFSMSMPKKMKHHALVSALTSQLTSGNIIVVDGLGGLEPKTKLIAKVLSGVTAQRRTLLVLADDSALVARSARNISYVDTMPVANVNTYTILNHQKIVFMKDAIAKLKEIVTKNA